MRKLSKVLMSLVMGGGLMGVASTAMASDGPCDRTRDCKPGYYCKPHAKEDQGVCIRGPVPANGPCYEWSQASDCPGEICDLSQGEPGTCQTGDDDDDSTQNTSQDDSSQDDSSQDDSSQDDSSQDDSSQDDSSQDDSSQDDSSQDDSSQDDSSQDDSSQDDSSQDDSSNDDDSSR
jgi:hypothetical protein